MMYRLIRKRPAGKRSQIEIMGLMIVVILLIVGVLFAVKFIVLKKPAETRQVYTRTQLASNLGMAMMAATTQNCRGTTIADLLKDCASWPGGTLTCDDPARSLSCVYVNDTIVKILNETVVTWNSKVEIKAWVAKGEYLFQYSTKGCTDKKPGESETLFLPTKAGTLSFKVFICE